MKFYSTNKKAPLASFQEAVFKGLPEDNGLYMPENIPALPSSFFDSLEDMTFSEIAFEVIKSFSEDEIPVNALREIVQNAFNFETEVVNLHDQVYALELFHGPTLAFKDYGARFMARVMSYFLQEKAKEAHILVATSGDTGSAVAQGFYKMPGIQVTLLYPKGKVSKIQEQQLTTVGENVTALEVDGTFDDCQKLVKTAFLDKELNEKMNLSSANSINIARLIPQSLYYFHAFRLVAAQNEKVLFSTPSGNFGNLSGGLLAQKMGLPINHFVAATNINKIVPEYLKTGLFEPKPSISTISNAMDVGNPSNFVRLLDLFDGDYEAIKKHISGIYFDDESTKNIIKEVARKYDYIMCPHTAIGYGALVNKMEETGSKPGVFLGTASPAKFGDVVNPVIGREVDIPKRLLEIVNRPKNAISMNADFSSFKEYLLS